MGEIIRDPFKPLRGMMVRRPGGKHRPELAIRDHRIEDLESEVLFLSLFNRALLDLLMENGICNLDDVGEKMRALDTLDNHGLPAEEVARELGMPMPERDRRQEFVDRLRPRKKESPTKDPTKD